MEVLWVHGRLGSVGKMELLVGEVLLKIGMALGLGVGYWVVSHACREEWEEFVGWSDDRIDISPRKPERQRHSHWKERVEVRSAFWMP